MSTIKNPIQGPVVSILFPEQVLKMPLPTQRNCESPLPPTLRPSESGSALFTKKVYTASGSSGVFTYDVVHESSKEYKGRLAVMFAVPYDFNIFYNWYAVGIFSKDKLCNDELYTEMYYGVQHCFIRGKAKGPSLTHKEGGVTIRASMSDSKKMNRC
uniref:Uncharacterized protein n=1 Tax=Poecilia reticulata TaxID=8081 RepID=A0A3P9P821_POERE